MTRWRGLGPGSWAGPFALALALSVTLPGPAAGQEKQPADPAVAATQHKQRAKAKPNATKKKVVRAKPKAAPKPKPKPTPRPKPVATLPGPAEGPKVVEPLPPVPHLPSENQIVTAKTPDDLYRQGRLLEYTGDQAGAFKAYLEAGEAGHGLAQRRLGELYGKRNGAVARDYETSLRWYRRAREQGVEIPRPHTYGR